MRHITAVRPRTCVVLCCTLCLLERCCERETHKLLAEGSIISLLLLFPFSLLGSSSFAVSSPPFPLLLLLPIFTSPFQVSSLLYYPLSLLHFSFIVSSSSLSAPMTVIGRPSFFHFLQHSVLASSPLASPSFLFSLCFLSFINLFSFCFLLLSPCQFTPFFTISLLPFLLYRLVFLLHCLISFVIFSILFLFPFLSYLAFLSTLIYLSSPYCISSPSLYSVLVSSPFLYSSAFLSDFIFSSRFLFSSPSCVVSSSPLLSYLLYRGPFPSPHCQKIKMPQRLITPSCLPKSLECLCETRSSRK